MEQEYRKLGGWLIFFIVSCSISAFLALNSFSSGSEAFTIFSQMGGSLATIATMTQIALFCALGGSVAGIVAVVMKKKKILIAFYVLILLSAVLTLLSVFMYPAYLDAVISSFKTTAIVACLRDMVVLGLWFRYFKVSKRASVYFNEAEVTQENDSISTND